MNRQLRRGDGSHGKRIIEPAAMRNGYQTVREAQRGPWDPVAFSRSDRLRFTPATKPRRSDTPLILVILGTAPPRIRITVLDFFRDLHHVFTKR